MVSRCPHFYTSFSFFFFFWLLSLGTICLLLTLPLAPSSSPIWVSSFTTCTNLLCGLPACSPFSASFVQYVQFMHMSTPSQPCLTNFAPKLLYLSCLSDVLVLILSIQATLIDEIICSAFWNSALRQTAWLSLWVSCRLTRLCILPPILHTRRKVHVPSYTEIWNTKKKKKCHKGIAVTIKSEKLPLTRWNS